MLKRKCVFCKKRNRVKGKFYCVKYQAAKRVLIKRLRSL